MIAEMNLEIDEGWDIDTKDWSENPFGCKEIAKQKKRKKGKK